MTGLPPAVDVCRQRRFVWGAFLAPEKGLVEKTEERITEKERHTDRFGPIGKAPASLSAHFDSARCHWHKRWRVVGCQICIQVLLVDRNTQCL